MTATRSPGSDSSATWSFGSIRIGVLLQGLNLQRTQNKKPRSWSGAGFRILRSLRVTLGRSAPEGDGANDDDNNNEDENLDEHGRNVREDATLGDQAGKGQA